MRERILELKKAGHDIASIADFTGHSLTEICSVIYKQNSIDKAKDRPADIVKLKEQVFSLVKVLHARTKAGDKVCLMCYLKKIGYFIDEVFK